MRSGALALVMLLLAAAAAADPRVQQRAFEEIPSGVYVRGGGTTVNVDPRCSGGCPDGQHCVQVCEDRPCDDDAPAGSACSACDWQCE